MIWLQFAAAAGGGQNLKLRHLPTTKLSYNMADDAWPWMWAGDRDNCAPCGLWGCKNRPAPFPDQMSYKGD